MLNYFIFQRFNKHNFVTIQSIGKVALFFLLCICSNTAVSQKVYYDISPLEGGSIAVDGFTEYTDPICDEFYNCNNTFTECSYRSFVELVIDPLTIADENAGYVNGKVYKLTVTYELEFLNELGILETISDKELSAEFTFDGGVFKNRMLTFYNDYKYHIKATVSNTVITSKVNGGNEVEEVGLSIPSSASFVAGVEIERYTPLNVYVSNIVGISLTPDNKLRFEMPMLDGAESYDLEWTWIDDDLIDNGTPEYNFKNNSTRINTFNPIYEISNIYRKGIIFARYRVNGYIPNDCSSQQKSNWGGISGTNIPETHEEGLNWQHSRSYAEEGKFKDVINYFDGSLRSRQTLSKLESENHVIATESIYDHAGRPVIQILPSPVIEGTAYETQLGYINNLNKSTLTNNPSYSYKDFEIEDPNSDNCGERALPLFTGSGAAQYYSPSNDLSDELLIGKEQDYVPDAEGYPLSQTLYTQDGTGRVSRQGGVGRHHQLFANDNIDLTDDNHDTRYYYGVPTQPELDRLFGIEAGYAQYYKKNMVVDPNRQVSVSYLDNKNRVVATALAGATPASLESLDLNSEDTFTIPADISKHSLPEDEEVGFAYVLNYPKTITDDDTPFIFDYSLNKQDFMNPECIGEICFDCVYELQLSIKDECGVLVAGFTAPVIINHTDDQDVLSCVPVGDELYSTKFGGEDQPILLNVGLYNISKVLRLNRPKMNEYEEIYVANDACITSLETLYHNLLLDVDLSTCGNLGNCPNEKISENPPIEGEDMEEYRARLLKLINECPEVESTEPEESECDLLLEGMLGDISPYGIYGGISLDAGGIVELTDETTPYCLSIFYETKEFNGILGLPEFVIDHPYKNITYYQFDENGEKVMEGGSPVLIEQLVNGVTLTPDEMPLPIFLQYFKESWAYNLLPLHPEYPSLMWCNLDGSNINEPNIAEALAFETEFLAVTTYEEANNKGFLNPLGLNNVPDINGVPINNYGVKDPFADFMPNELLIEDIEETFSVNIWALSYLVTISNIIDMFALLNLVSTDVDWITLVSGQIGICNADRYWESFKTLYINSIRKGKLSNHLGGYTLAGYSQYYFFQLKMLSDCSCCEIDGVDPPDDCVGDCDEICEVCPEYGPAMKRFSYNNDGLEVEETPEPSSETLVNANETCVNNCQAYRSDWRTDYVRCWDATFDITQPVLESDVPADYKLLFDVYEGICATGCQYDLMEVNGVLVRPVEHMAGSSTLPQEHSGYMHSNGVKYLSFEDAYSKIIMNISGGCNALLVDAPVPYDTDIFAGQMPFIEPCVCDKYNHIYAEYELTLSGNEVGNVADFEVYLESNYNYNSDVYEINDIDCVCRIGSTYLVDVPVNSTPLPEVFACKSCVTCPQMFDVVDAFNNDQIYGGLFDDVVGPLYYNEHFRDVFTNWTNNYLNFNLAFTEYFDYMSYCGVYPSYSDEAGGIILNDNSTLNFSNKEKDKGDDNSRFATLDGQVSLTINVLEETAESNDAISIQVNLKNDTQSEISGLYFKLKLPAGWEYSSNPIGNYINETLTYDDFSLDGDEILSWIFTTNVPSNIYLARNYNSIASIADGATDLDPIIVEDGVYVDIPDPCSNKIETSEDMADFLNKVIKKYIEIGGDACNNAIPLASIAGYETSTINKWDHIDILNQSIQLCIMDTDNEGVANDYVFTFINTCNNLSDCEFVIYNVDDLNHIYHQDLGRAKIRAVTAAHNYNFSIDHELHVEYVDSRYDQTLVLDASSTGGCYSFDPCDKRILCNRSIAIPFEEENGCINSILDISNIQANYEFSEMIENSRDTFQKKYVEQCLDRSNLNEVIKYTIESKEHHYTLYYYDQSGSLVKTIPPKGVIPLNKIETVDVGYYRDGLATNNQTPKLYPDHKMPTKYKYNSFGQIDEQQSPDLDVKTRYWYDRLGRPVLSQDGRQQQLGNTYSYTLYDKLGRIVEVGELVHNQSFDDYINDPNTVYDIVEEYDVSQYLSISSIQKNIIKTIYDENLTYFYNGETINTDDKFDLVQDPLNPYKRNYLRKRISSSLFIEIRNIENPIEYDYATHYDYDIHGNVKTILQEFRELENLSHSVKRIDYKYDLISGNVHEVAYQKGHIDQFFHRYTYDADNRITSVKTSKDGFIWDNDASYTYYDHGPLARTDLGEYDVQGCDYIYTIHGWIKAVNTTNLNEENDPGNDGDINESDHPNVGNDAYAYSLHYYDEDYKGIRATEADFAGAVPTGMNNLYNGNISKMNTALRGLDNTALEITPNLYTYDQLHRITSMEKFDPIDIASGSFTWGSLDVNESYKTTYSYDPNGNLQELMRRDATGNLYDDLKYIYDYTDTEDVVYSNRLYYITDQITNNTADNNLQGHEGVNYFYDGSGNIVHDLEEDGLTEWDHYGKIRKIIRNGPITPDNPNIDYHYDAMGNRIVKVVDNGEGGGSNSEVRTYYVRDASGNVMAIYKAKEINNILSEIYEKEHHIYGRSRLGIKYSDIPTIDIKDNNSNPSLDEDRIRMSGNRSYELSNHLGNVLSSVSDNKLLEDGIDANNVYRPEILSYSDYYPFGWGMPGRTGVSMQGHRYGFNGKEKDDDVKGSGVQYDYGFRIYDSRIARFLSVDPLTRVYPMLTPYQFASNTPIEAIDLDGLEAMSTKHLYELETFFGGLTKIPSYEKVTKDVGVHKEKIVETYTMEVDGKIYSVDHIDSGVRQSAGPMFIFAYSPSINFDLFDIRGLIKYSKFEDELTNLYKVAGEWSKNMGKNEERDVIGFNPEGKKMSGKSSYEDTYRHLLLMSLATILTNEESAKIAGDIHERSGKNNGEAAKVVDLFNNMFGIELGTKLKEKYSIEFYMDRYGNKFSNWNNDNVAGILNDVTDHMISSFPELENSAHTFSPSDGTVIKLVKLLKQISTVSQ